MEARGHFFVVLDELFELLFGRDVEFGGGGAHLVVLVVV